MFSRFARTFMITILALLLLTALIFIYPRSPSYIDPWTGQLFGEGGVEKTFSKLTGGSTSLLQVAKGNVIMPKLGNATAKAALGRATWKLMHTMTLRFPENPTSDERTALSSFFYLTARLYPCGECAEEFQTLLKKFPPQTSSRKSAALWLCHLHNEVNERLEKPRFDCAHLSKEYDCGCGDDPVTMNSTSSSPDSEPMDLEEDSSLRDQLTGAGMIKGGI